MRRDAWIVFTGVMKTAISLIAVAAALLAPAIPAHGEDDAMLEPGQPFPAFELPAQDGTTVSSAELAGSPYLLFFYPKANTGG